MNTKVSIKKLLGRAFLTALIPLTIYVILREGFGIPTMWSNVFLIGSCLVPGARYIFDGSYRKLVANKVYYVFYEISLIVLSYYVIAIIFAIIISLLFPN